MDLTFYQFSRALGKIDNRNSDVQVLGYDSGPTFTTSYTIQNTTTTDTYVTDHLSVDFVQNVLALVPSIRITSPMRQRLYWAIQALWFLPLIDKGGLNLTRVDSAGNYHGLQNRFGLIGLNQAAITAAFNGQPVTHSPYSLGGFYLGATVGVCLPRSRNHEKDLIHQGN